MGEDNECIIIMIIYDDDYDRSHPAVKREAEAVLQHPPRSLRADVS